jgi:hypothetical protein
MVIEEAELKVKHEQHALSIALEPRERRMNLNHDIGSRTAVVINMHRQIPWY